MSRRLLIVWYSATGAARALAEAAFEAARAEGPATIIAALDVMPAALLGHDGYIFAAPENLAALAGPMKAALDRCYYPVLGQIEGRPYASLIAAGSDGRGAAAQLARIATGWRLRAVAPPLIVCTHAQTPAAIQAEKHLPAAETARAAELGATLGAGLALGVF